MLFWKKNKIDKKFLGAKKAVIPKTAQKTIPFQEAYENGLFLNYDGSYSLIFSFENIDYSLFRDEEKQEVYKKYTQLMNSIPTDIKLQEFLMNTDIDTDILRETLMPFSQDYPEISDDYRKIMGDVISGSTEAGAKKIMLMALSYKPTGSTMQMCCSSAIRTCSSFFLLSALQQSSCFPKKFLRYSTNSIISFRKCLLCSRKTLTAVVSRTMLRLPIFVSASTKLK